MFVEIDFVCRHIRCDDFRCGNDLLDANLRAAVADPVDPAHIVYLVAHEDHVARGYAAVLDVVIEVEDAARPTLRCLLIAALATDHRYAGGQVGPSLLARALELLSQRPPYDAIAVTSFPDREIEARFERLGFQRAPGNGVLWYRILPQR